MGGGLPKKPPLALDKNSGVGKPPPLLLLLLLSLAKTGNPAPTSPTPGKSEVITKLSTEGPVFLHRNRVLALGSDASSLGIGWSLWGHVLKEVIFPIKDYAS